MYRKRRDSRALSVFRQTQFGFSLAGPDYVVKPDWEAEEKQVFLEYLDRSSVCIDIGANVGFYSCLAGSRGKQVIAFEPLPANLKFLYANIEHNSLTDVEVFPLGLSDKPGLSRLYGIESMASFVSGWGKNRNPRNTYSVVPVTTLDNVTTGRFEGSQLLIKMDVEGFEYQVLKGARKMLDLDPKPYWLVENMLSHPTIPGGFNERFGQVFDLFWRHKYKAACVTPDRSAVERADVEHWLAAVKTTSPGTDNFLFTSR